MAVVKLIGYSSDDLPAGTMRFGKLIKTKKQRIEEIDAGIKQPTKQTQISISKNNSKLYCCYCECELNNQNITREHVWPKSKGGKGKTFSHYNIKPCCKFCNREKADMTPIDYIKYLYDQAGKVDGILLAKKIVNVQNICGVEYEKYR